ncbi:DUF6639 family protein [Aliiruegeria lutimaris]|uniref:Metallopeptidase n=1 Tax=Aliiruegeria lutimaris TaxID=571298 RepID=A0A1G9CD59_9RHOB|nr:DUF6639 family protein [Aliiruegeria lutimaris]SDK49589.1 hypothetical protein SAMN04488026_10439 [Aliiruegeria lutimaris]
MTSGMGKFLLVALVAMSCAFTFLAANGAPLACGTPLVRVDTEDRTLHARICEIVASALPMLDGCHLKLTKPVTITFSDNLENAHGSCFGLFHPDRKQVELLTPRAFAQAHDKSESWHAIPLAEHFDAIALHEFVHALVDQTAVVERSCTADEEYIAYAMQIESLSDATRSRLLKAVDASPPIAMEEINPLLLGFAPPSFAVKSWLHFSEPGNGCDFVQKLMRGDVTLWLYPE